MVVMNKGKIVEQGDVNTIYQSPQQSYTRDLLKAIPGQK